MAINPAFLTPESTENHFHFDSATVIKPGDRVLIGLGESSGSLPENFAAIAKALNERFPEVEFTLVAGSVTMAAREGAEVYSGHSEEPVPPTNDYPCEPRIEFSSSDGDMWLECSGHEKWHLNLRLDTLDEPTLVKAFAYHRANPTAGLLGSTLTQGILDQFEMLVDDTIPRLERAIARLEEKRDAIRSIWDPERIRFQGKVEGVKLALSYLRERS